MDCITYRFKDLKEDLTVWQFSQLDTTQLTHKRNHLFCPNCGAKAYYRRNSRDSKEACFGARPHNPGCIIGNSKLSSTEQKDIEDVSIILKSDNGIMINFELTHTHSQDDVIGTSTQLTNCSHHRAAHQRHTLQPITHKIANRGLKTLLNYLFRFPDFSQSDTWIHTSQKNKWRAKNLFVKFEDAVPDNEKPRMFWGMISSADESMNWLNTSGKDNISIPIRPFKKILIDTLNIHETDEFAGCYAIAFGWCRESKNGKLYLKVKNNNPTYIFIKRTNNQP